MISGLIPCSFIDYPGELAAVLFTQGCDLRCLYCHNPQLCKKTGDAQISFDKLTRFLTERKGKLTAVTVTGGEPALHQELPKLLSLIHSLGFAVKVDTNGMHPKIIEKLVSKNLVDYVAVDFKAPPSSGKALSKSLTGVEDQGERALETLQYLVKSKILYEARTTVVEAFHDKDCLKHMADCLALAGVKKWKLQPVEKVESYNKLNHLNPPSNAVLAESLKAAKKLGIDAAIRPSYKGT